MRFKGKVYRKGVPWLTVAGDLRGTEGTFLTSGGFYAAAGDPLELRLDDGRRLSIRVLDFRMTRDGQAEVRFVTAGPPR
jgi:hypothetical protein